MSVQVRSTGRAVVVGAAGVDYVGHQGINISPRISAASGAERLCAFYVWLEPGAETVTHHHTDEETVVLVLKGSNELLSGDDLTDRLQVSSGDLVFIPAGCPHKVVAGPEGAYALEVRSGNAENSVVME
ncbi:cupin domain-containing protein [Streptomyces lavendulae]|uniref:cupin domain-containing protein n=1 Tax=Streptomyces lavendulae TaxID=1914 RepID=UPI00369F6398